MITRDGINVSTFQEYLRERALDTNDYVSDGDGSWAAVIKRYVITVDDRAGVDVQGYDDEREARLALAEIALTLESTALDVPGLALTHVHVCDLPRFALVEAHGDPAAPRFHVHVWSTTYAATVSDWRIDCDYCDPEGGA